MSLSNQSIDRVLELACIDLIQRNRRGETARVEEYLQQHPALIDPAYLLDLVDAEICVRKELGETLRVDDWRQRFPQQTHAIQQLISLEVSIKELVSTRSLLSSEIVSTSSERTRSGNSLSFSGVDFSDAMSEALTVAGSDSLSEESCDGTTSSEPSLFPSPPIKLPTGFMVDSGVSTRPGVWLLRCHEEHGQESCAFKIVDVARVNSAPLTSKELKSLLDASELASRVRHSVWVQPLIATCDGRFLGVIRPWMFGVNWRQGVSGLSTRDALRLLASLAFGLHAAHQLGCHHGNVCESNLFLTHTGDLRLTDPVNTFTPQILDGKVSPAELIRDDALMFCRLIASIQLDASRNSSSQLVAQCHSLVQRHSTDTMATIGEWLIRIADDVTPKFQPSQANERNPIVSWLKSIFSRRNRDVLTAADTSSH